MIRDNYKRISDALPFGVKLIAVSKFHPIDEINEAYEAGARCFGENRVQEMVAKAAALPKEIEWHLIGQLQLNKVRQAVAVTRWIHSVDSESLLAAINNESQRINQVTNCLLEFHIATESTKSGMTIEEAELLLSSKAFQAMQNIKVCGVMGMASFTEDEATIRQEFQTLRMYFNTLKARFFVNDQDFKELSMGMSSDWPIAIEEGSTMIRVGTSIFGPRPSK